MWPLNSSSHFVSINYCSPHRAATYFCLESVWKLDLFRKFVEKFRSLFRCFTSSQSLPRSTQSSKVKWRPKPVSENVVSAKKVKIYDSLISEHALKGNGNKLIVKEFLGTLKSATSWLNIHDYCVWESDANASYNSIFKQYKTFSVFA